MLSRKHYKAIAEIIKRNYVVSTDTVGFVLRDIIDEIAQYFASDNPRFNRHKFLDACKDDFNENYAIEYAETTYYQCEHSFIDSDNDGEYGKELCRYCGKKQDK